MKRSAPAVVLADLEVLRRRPTDPDYDPQALSSVVLARIRTPGPPADPDIFASRLTGRTGRGPEEAVALLTEELELLAAGYSVDEVREYFVKREGIPRRLETFALPAVSSLEQAAAIPYGQQFVFDNPDVPTDTGRTFKQWEPCVRVRCGDGSDRIVHTRDLGQILDENGVPRSYRQVTRGRRARAKERASSTAKEATE